MAKPKRLLTKNPEYFEYRDYNCAVDKTPASPYAHGEYNGYVELKENSKFNIIDHEMNKMIPVTSKTTGELYNRVDYMKIPIKREELTYGLNGWIGFDTMHLRNVGVEDKEWAMNKCKEIVNELIELEANND